MREFITGATRDSAENKPDYEGYLSPTVLERYGKYMQMNQLQADGKVRSSDNWQKGIPIGCYMSSKWRHFMETWMLHRKGAMSEDEEFATLEAIEESLCAELFNTMGMLHEILKS